MNKLNKILLTIAFLVIFPITVHADCESDFKAYESKITVDYQYNSDTDDFTITIVIPDWDRYTIVHELEDDFKRSTYTIDYPKITYKINNHKAQVYMYSIAAVYSGCDREIVKTETIKLEKYNRYSDSPLCKGNEEFILCQKEYVTEIDQAAFESRIKAYIENKNNPSKDKEPEEKKDSQEKKTNKNSLFSKIIKYINENLLTTIAIAIFVVALIITIVLEIKSAIKSRRFE